MKTVVTILMMCLLAISQSGCNSEMNAWAWEEDDSLGVRIGGFLSENNEAGGSMNWQDEDSGPRVLGLYALHHFPEKVEFRNPLILDFLPETLFGTAYLGGKLDVNLDTNNTSLTPVAGVIFADTLFIEQSLDGNSMFGLRARIPF